MKIRTLPDAPFAVDVLPFRRTTDRWEVAVVAKATYAIEPGGCRLLQQPIGVYAEERRFDDAASSLYAPRDLVPLKAQPEIVVVGAQPQATFRLAGGAARPLRRPPVWPPAGAGPRAPWHVTDLAAAPLGEDFDGSVFQYAPIEQRLDRLSLARRIVIENASPRTPTIEVVFPPIEPVVRIESLESTARAVVMSPELVWVDVERGVSTVTWRGTTNTEFGNGFEVVLGTSEGGELRWPDRQGHVVASARWDEDADDEDSIELPTEVTTLGRPSDTYTGQHVVEAQAPECLAPAGARRDPDSSPPVSSPPPPPAEHVGVATAGRAIVPHPAREMIADLRGARPTSRSSAPPAAEEAAVPLALDVCWWDESCAELTERNEDHARIVAEHTARNRALDEAVDPWWHETDDEVDEDPVETEQAISLVLRGAPCVPLAAVERELMRALDVRRRSSAPLALVVGKLQLGFDARVALEVYAEAARPLAKSDKALAATLEHVDQLLQTPLGAVAEVARGQRARIARQWRAANRDLPADFLEQSSERILLQQRSFDKREVLDAPHLRTMLVDGDVAVPLYLPEAAGKRVPLFHAFEARVIAELWPRQDERETHPVSLRAIAVARLVE